MSVVNQPMPDKLATRWIETPIGAVEIGINLDSEVASLWYVEIVATENLRDPKNQDQHPILDLAQEQLSKYFRGEETNFSELLAHQSNYGTAFQQQVWQALTQIPYGQTWSYGELANFISNPKAVRAVGAANGKNPLAIVVPCHRVIGANGTLTGYAGGLDNKQKLLSFESKVTGD
ncbi:methylated-DNA--[protein]-cysteine S-methyltransferase [Psychrosphaera haliotis]|nr:methylated-DNA--[protein]-cysteine S-methyltransferase [Psychrosphaera haliotis]